jgi:hypothetical protein
MEESRDDGDPGRRLTRHRTNHALRSLWSRASLLTRMPRWASRSAGRRPAFGLVARRAPCPTGSGSTCDGSARSPCGVLAAAMWHARDDAMPICTESRPARTARRLPLPSHASARGLCSPARESSPPPRASGGGLAGYVPQRAAPARPRTQCDVIRPGTPDASPSAHQAVSIGSPGPSTSHDLGRSDAKVHHRA